MKEERRGASSAESHLVITKEKKGKNGKRREGKNKSQFSREQKKVLLRENAFCSARTKIAI